MRAITRIKADLSKIDEAIAAVMRGEIGDAKIEKVIVSESAWLKTFGSYDADAGGLVAKRKMETSGIPVEFGDVDSAVIVVSIFVDVTTLIEEPDMDPIKRSKAKKK